jgi:hypothetical protein
MNPLMINTAIQLLKAFIPAEDADKIREVVTAENVQNCVNAIVNLGSTQQAILANQKLIMDALNVNGYSDGRSNGTSNILIAAE